ncbi:hypothetical protein [Paenibacillus sp. LK1]|uniref:hypothetical protein n=1 Tax=Paenibacillus sp. LK1 TaxID=2053014 RepID=UPI0015D488D3|nr:hypothetical protein [Paenibacillus sp. LK1]
MVDNMNKEELEMAILENDIVDVMDLPDDISVDELRSIVREWILNGDETHESCK